MRDEVDRATAMEVKVQVAHEEAVETKV
jgi:hypothetical protein